MIEKIKELFEIMGCPAIVILRTSKSGEVDNGHGVDFDLPEYAVIYSGDHNYYENYSKKIEFEDDNKIDINGFSELGCKYGIDSLIKELNELDGYEIQWRK